MKSKIVEGTINNILSREEELYLSRITICKKCKLYTTLPFFGGVCSNKLFYNKDKDEVSNVPKKDYIKGCGCILNSKCRVPEANCPVGKW